VGKALPMRFVITALVAMALGLLPAATVRAEAMPANMEAHGSSMPCHGMAPVDLPEHDQDRQSCADHCLSQVNGFAQVARLTGPSLQNAVRAGPVTTGALGKLRQREPPDPPPPRA
jgi:hypothetical protein